MPFTASADAVPSSPRRKAAVLATSIVAALAMVLAPGVAHAADAPFDSAGTPRIVDENLEVLAAAPRLGQTLVVDVASDDWSPMPDDIETDWYVGSTLVAHDATSYTPVESDYGKAIHVVATARATGFQTTSRSSAPTLPVTAEQFVADAPRIVLDGETVTGSPALNTALVAEVGEWMPLPDELTYQWLLDGSPIEDAVENSFTPTTSEMGGRLSVSVTARAAGYLTKTVTSAQTGPVEVQEYSGPGTVGFTGAAVVGGTLTANAAGWPDAAALSFTWFDAVSGETLSTATTFSPAAADIGRTVGIRVTATVGRFAPTTRSGNTAVVQGAFTAHDATITGTARAGNTLTAQTGTWPDGTTLAYRWYRSGAADPVGDEASYVLGVADIGQRLNVVVTADAPLTATATLTSAQTTVVAPFAFSVAPAPTISGARAIGSTLTASAGAWSDDPALAYQWMRAGVAITNATAPSYKTTSADLGKAITVVVTASAPYFETTSRTSAALPAGVFNAAPTPTISGTAAYGRTLTAKPGTWSPAATLTYQWQRNGVNISGATKSTYKLTSSDIGKKVSVTVRGARSGYQTLAKTSAKTATVLRSFSKASTPTVSGTRTYGHTLTAKVGTWSPSAKLKYQWQRNGVNISGATKSTYKLTTSDVGKKIRVVVTGSRSGYLTLTKYSAQTSTIAR